MTTGSVGRMASGLGPSVASTVVSIVSFTSCIETVWELGVVSSVLGFGGGGVVLGAGRHRSREIGTRVPLSSTTSTVSNTCLIKLIKQVFDAVLKVWSDGLGS